MKRSRLPSGWNEGRVRKVLEHYERQAEDEAVAEDEAAFRLRGQTVMVVPRGLVPAITRLIERLAQGWEMGPRRAVGAPRSAKANRRARGECEGAPSGVQ
jgi:hypothetical protein